MSEKKPSAVKWWKLPPHYPLRIGRKFAEMASRLRELRAEMRDDEPSQWEVDSGYDRPKPSPHEVARIQASYDRARALWEAAGRPNRDGKRAAPP